MNHTPDSQERNDDSFYLFYEKSAYEQRAIDRLGQTRYRKALSLISLPHDTKILDIGCKRGSLASVLEDKNIENHHYTGLDIAATNIQRNQARWPKSAFIQADITQQTPFETGSFDCIFALEVMEHVSSPGNMLQEINRILAPDGNLLLSVPNPYYWAEVINELRGASDTQGHLYSWTRGTLRRLLDFNKLDVINETGTYFEIPTRVRGAWVNDELILWKNAPRMLSRSTIVRCRKRGVG